MMRQISVNRRGVGTVIGGVLFVVLVVTSLLALYSFFGTFNSYVGNASQSIKLNQAKSGERLVIWNAFISSGALTFSLANFGSTTVTLTDLWIYDLNTAALCCGVTTGTPPTSFQSSAAVLSPGQQVTFTTSSSSQFVTTICTVGCSFSGANSLSSTDTYSISVITQLGSSFSTQVGPNSGLGFPFPGSNGETSQSARIVVPAGFASTPSSISGGGTAVYIGGVFSNPTPSAITVFSVILFSGNPVFSGATITRVQPGSGSWNVDPSGNIIYWENSGTGLSVAPSSAQEFIASISGTGGTGYGVIGMKVVTSVGTFTTLSSYETYDSNSPYTSLFYSSSSSTVHYTGSAAQSATNTFTIQIVPQRANVPVGSVLNVKIPYGWSFQGTSCNNVAGFTVQCIQNSDGTATLTATVTSQFSSAKSFVFTSLAPAGAAQYDFFTNLVIAQSTVMTATCDFVVTVT